MLNGQGSAPKVVVVAGSLGGLFDAIGQRSLGYEVDVYGKSSGLMRDRGAGLGNPAHGSTDSHDGGRRWRA